MKTLDLVLKTCWYDKIASGEKTSEYREIKPFWNNRFCGGKDIIPTDKTECLIYDKVVFHRAYTSTTMTFEVKTIRVTCLPNDLGLDKCWEIVLGNRIA